MSKDESKDKFWIYFRGGRLIYDVHQVIGYVPLLLRKDGYTFGNQLHRDNNSNQEFFDTLRMNGSWLLQHNCGVWYIFIIKSSSPAKWLSNEEYPPPPTGRLKFQPQEK